MIETSQTFCRLAWTNLATTQHGACKLCNVASDDRTIMDWQVSPKTVGWDADGIGTIWNGGYMQEVRRRMLAGERVQDCRPCYLAEESGATSNRQVVNMDDFYHAEGGYDIVARRTPFGLDLHLGNRCNLACHGCWGGNSSSVLSMRTRAVSMHDAGELAMPSWMRAAWNGEILSLARKQHFYSRSDDYTSEPQSLDNFRTLAPTLRRFYVSGGEPTMYDGLRSYLDALSDAGNLGCYVGWSTNCTSWNEDLIQGIAGFDYNEIQLSVDALGTVNEYIRRPTVWSDVESNLRRYMLDRRVRSVKVFTVISALNVAVLCDLLDYLRAMADETGRKVTWWPIRLRSPEYQDIRVLDSDKRLEIARALESYLDGNPDTDGNLDYHIGLRGVIDQLREGGSADSGRLRRQLSEYLNYSDRLDGLIYGTGRSWREDLPHLEIGEE